MYTVVTFTSYIPPKCAKTREPKDEHCVLWSTYIRDNIHGPISLDKLKKHTALPYIIWRLIWDLKNKEKRDPSDKILPDGHPRIKNQISEQEGKRERRKY